MPDYATLNEYECLDPGPGKTLAEDVHKLHLLDFSNWKNHAAFARAFARLEKDLRTTLGK